MSSDRTRAIGIFAVVALVAGGAGFWFVEIYRPGQILKDAQGEIAGWETRWTSARGCLLGAAPGSPVTAEALAIRELMPDPWNAGSCTQQMAKLTRGDAVDSGVADVEPAWAELDQAATKAAAAFATHVATPKLDDDPLPAALDALDAAHAKLRAAAKLPPADATGKPLQVAQIVPITDGAEPLERIDLDAVPSARGMIAYGNTPSHVVQVTLRTGGAPAVAKLAPGARRVPDGSWGASPFDGGVRIGKMDVEGVIASPLEVKLPKATVLAVAGTLDQGIVVAANEHQLVLAHLEAGALHEDKPIAIETAYAVTDLEDGWFAFAKRPGADFDGFGYRHGAASHGAGSAPPACFSAVSSWSENLGGLSPLFRDAGTHADLPYNPPGMLLGCTPDGALARAGGIPRGFELCTETACRATQMPKGAPERATTTIVGGKLVALAEHGGVIGVWREDGAPTFYALPEPAHFALSGAWPMMAMTDGKVIDVLARGKQTFVIVRVPAS